MKLKNIREGVNKKLKQDEKFRKSLKKCRE